MNTYEGEDATASLSTPIMIGGVEVFNRVFLAPMSGVTDACFRRLAWRFGAGLVFSEMVASEALLAGESEMVLKALSADAGPHAVQLAGREPRWMALAARMAEDNGADIIDINMGCPAKRVTTGYSGSALMRDPELALSIVEAVVGSVSVPVTLKMRLGWDERSLNAPQIARAARDAGIGMITIHGRTRCQFYEGKADWRAVRAVRDVIDIPLAVNGDIASVDDANSARALSGADAVMVGRASYGAPWLAGNIASGRNDVSPRLIAEMAIEHYEAMLSLYGRESGRRQARKHIAWYLDRLGVVNASPRRKAMLTADDPANVLAGLRLLASDPGCMAEAA